MQNKCGWRFNKGHLDTWVAQQGPKKKKKTKDLYLTQRTKINSGQSLKIEHLFKKL